MQRTECLVMLGEALRLEATLQHDLGVIYCDLLTHATHSRDTTQPQQLALARDRISELQQRLTRTHTRITQLHIQLGDDDAPSRQRSSDEALRATQRIQRNEVLRATQRIQRRYLEHYDSCVLRSTV